MDAQAATQHTEPPNDTESLIRQAQQLIARPFGRPSLYTETLIDEICDRVATGVPLYKVCLADDMPDKVTVTRWLQFKPDFRTKLQDARARSAHFVAEEAFEIVDDSSNDLLVQPDGRYLPNMAAVKRSDVRAGFRRWLAGVYDPRTYGDKQHVEHTGSITLEMATRLDTALRRLDVIDVQPEPAQSTETQALVPVRQTYSPDSK